jgi:hypothetical protein
MANLEKWADSFDMAVISYEAWLTAEDIITVAEEYASSGGEETSFTAQMVPEIRSRLGLE